MKKEFSSSVSWNSAALAGLVMGVFTIAVDYLPSLPLLLGGTGVFVGILNFILKVVKIVACVIAFKYLWNDSTTTSRSVTRNSSAMDRK